MIMEKSRLVVGGRDIFIFAGRELRAKRFGTDYFVTNTYIIHSTKKKFLSNLSNVTDIQPPSPEQQIICPQFPPTHPQF